jgi:hypothetical protein
VTVDHSWVGGKKIVESGKLTGIDTRALVNEHNRLAATLV